MRYPLFIYGEIHTPEERTRVEELIMEEHVRKPFDYFLCEDLGEYYAGTDAMKSQMVANCGEGKPFYGISPRSVEFSTLLKTPIVGIDDWGDDSARWLKRGRVDKSFEIREKRMVKLIGRYHLLGRCAVIVGDTHLRTISTTELGKPSLLQTKFARDRTVTIVRSPIGEIK